MWSQALAFIASLLAVVFLPVSVDAEVPIVNVCDPSNSANSNIYCYGPLLDAVNNLTLYNDSKYFVDMPLIKSPNETLADFYQEFPTPIQVGDRVRLQKFVDSHFDPPGSELKNCTPIDWTPYPPKLMNISDPHLRAWALELNDIWKDLCRQVDSRILDNPEKYSIIYVAEPFIAPGGRFREYYYWDAYWIVKGLLASEMYTTTRHMISNLASMVDRFGFVPNGGRVYYLQRSQPPLLTAMVYEYYEATNNDTFVRAMLPLLVKELNFWLTKRNVSVTLDNGNTYTAYRYNTPSNVPRPEAYSEDVKNSQNMSESDRRQFYQDIASSAESGWDFSSRWFRDKSTIQTIETTNILPVDLNAFICWNMDILQYLFEQTGNRSMADYYRKVRADFRQTLDAVFYNSTMGAWYDYNMRTRSQNVEFYPSTAVPLFTGCYQSLNHWKAFRLFQYMQDVGAFAYPGGVPTSLVNNTNEQWDFPNGWSPLNHMVIEGLRKSDNPQMQDQAFRLAEKWILGNYRVFNATNESMYEKYDVIGKKVPQLDAEHWLQRNKIRKTPLPGGGGEYKVQKGFGWTNGVILDLLTTYNNRLRLAPLATSAETAPRPLNALLVLSAILTFSSVLLAQ